MDQFFEPKSMAVIGVSDSKMSLGRIVFLNAFRLGFSGDVFGVGSFSDAEFAHRMVRTIGDLPDDLELAVVLAPADSLPEILDQCGRKGIRHVVIESAGFSEYGESGKSLEDKTVAVARAYGMRLMGPNGVGTINVSKRLFLPFAPVSDLGEPGAISLISQSGGVGTHFFLRLVEEGLGLSKFASVGNKLDLDEVDFLEYLVGDPDTSVIGMYLESITRGKALFDVMRGSSKPIVILKSNRSERTAKAAQSHTAALSSDDDVVDAAIRQAGAIRVGSASEMIDTLKLLTLPPMKGNRVAILSRSGGHAVVTVDACVEKSLTLARFPQPFIDGLSELYPSRVIARQNPLDLGEIFDYPLFAKIVDRTLALDEVDGVIFNHIYAAGAESQPSRVFLQEVKKLQDRTDKPIVVTVATELSEVTESARQVRFPLFADPEAAVSALHRATRAFRQRESHRSLGATRAEKNNLETWPRFEGKDPLLPEAFSILQQWKLPVAPFRFVAKAELARSAARELGYPVAIKLVSRKASHKTDVGGVALHVADDRALSKVMAEMERKALEHLGPDQVQGFCLQPMIEGGIEVIVGGRRDPQFGPVILLGLGGVLVELIRDHSLRLAPISEPEARSMVDDLRGKAVFEGYRGDTPGDVDALAALIARVSQFMVIHTEIEELDLNPVKVLPDGAQILDARMTLEAMSH